MQNNSSNYKRNAHRIVIMVHTIKGEIGHHK